MTDDTFGKDFQAAMSKLSPPDHRDRRIAELEAENERLRKVMARAAEVIKVNLYHQREKVEDARSILIRALEQ